MIDIKVPAVGESISEVTLVKWLKKEGQYVERDEVIAELESEKATFEGNPKKAARTRASVRGPTPGGSPLPMLVKTMRPAVARPPSGPPHQNTRRPGPYPPE